MSGCTLSSLAAFLALNRYISRQTILDKMNMTFKLSVNSHKYTIGENLIFHLEIPEVKDPLSKNSDQKGFKIIIIMGGGNEIFYNLREAQVLIEQWRVEYNRSDRTAR